MAVLDRDRLRREAMPSTRDVAHLRANCALSLASITWLPCTFVVLDDVPLRLGGGGQLLGDAAAAAVMLLILLAAAIGGLIASPLLLALTKVLGDLRGLQPDTATLQATAARASFGLLAVALTAPIVFVIGGGMLATAELLSTSGHQTRLLPLILLGHATIVAIYGLFQVWTNVESPPG